MEWATSIRNPSAPRSSQKRSVEANSSCTSGLSQLTSGCEESNRCRYHWPGLPSASVTRVQADPPNTEAQLFGGCEPSSPAPSRNMYRARSALPGSAHSAASNHRCSLLVWLGTISTTTRRPSPWAVPIRSSASSSVPKIGSTSR